MKISQALSLAKKELIAKDIPSHSLDALLLMSCATSFSKEKIIFNPDLILNESQKELFLELLKRRLNYEPISHIIQKREFYGLDFFVNKDVLDPRPDSETLIELVFKKFADKNLKFKILELGTGSGCLIITLLKNYPFASAIGVDISKKALEVCKKNAINNQVDNRLRLIKSNLFDEIYGEKFDLIISNPPYIPTGDINFLQNEVKDYEPLIALDGGFDGLDFYKKIAKIPKEFLNKNGKIIVEIGINQEKDIIEIFAQNNFINSDFSKDLPGIIRILEFKCC